MSERLGARLQESARNTEELTRVMTFNIAGSTTAFPDSWASRRELNLTVVRVANPHVLGLQEAEYGNLEDYRNHLPRIDHVPGPLLKRGEFNAIAWDKFRMELLTTDQNGISLHPDGKPNTPAEEWGSKVPRGATWAVLLDHYTGQSVLVLNVHLDHESERARVEGMKMVLRKVADFGDMPAIITGDFNAGEYVPEGLTTRVPYTGETLRLMREAGFQDTFLFTNTDGPKTNTFHGFKGDEFNPDEDFGLHRIDGIWVRGFNPVSTDIIRTNQHGFYPSDHYPVVALVKPSAAGAKGPKGLPVR
jgi:endonuclease/exonuclease/phosphatase family metal-dependent hydrolase